MQATAPAVNLAALPQGQGQPMTQAQLLALMQLAQQGQMQMQMAQLQQGQMMAGGAQPMVGGAQAIMRPMPVSQLPVPAAVQANQEKLRGVVENAIKPDANGIVHLKLRPSAHMTMLMCPFPFFCLGCCLSASRDIIIDERRQTLEMTSYCGYCCCLKSEPEAYTYQDVANICLIRKPGVYMNRRATYQIAFVMRDGKRVFLSDPNLPGALFTDLLSYHYFFYGRNNPNYQMPNPGTLAIDF